MTIQLPEDLERFVHAQVQAGLFSSEEDMIRQAFGKFKRGEPPIQEPSSGDRLIGGWQRDAALLDQIVEDAMRHRQEPGREFNFDE